MNQNSKFSFLSKLMTISMLIAVTAIPNAMAYPDNQIDGVEKIPIYPAGEPGTRNAGVTQFDWQDEWGSIHMNTFADGLKDPGQPTTIDSNLACPAAASLCNNPQIVGDDATKVDKITEAEQTEITHGIKYDIKNSVLNCMGRVTPTFPSTNGGWRNLYSTYVCDIPNKQLAHPHYHETPSLRYNPVWDPRGNDYYNTNRADGEYNRQGHAGCLQQISNSCANDVHECRLVNKPDGSGFIPEDQKPWEFPVTHSFYPREVQDLRDSGMVGDKLPMKYYEYTKPGVDQHPWTRTAIKAKITNQKDAGRMLGKLVHNGYETQAVQDLAQTFTSVADMEAGLSGLGEEEIILKGNNVPDGDYILVEERTQKDQPNPEYEQCMDDANAAQTSHDDVAAIVTNDGIPSDKPLCAESATDWEPLWDGGNCAALSLVKYKSNGQVKNVLPNCNLFDESQRAIKAINNECFEVAGECNALAGDDNKCSGDTKISLGTAVSNTECMELCEQTGMTNVTCCQYNTSSNECSGRGGQPVPTGATASDKAALCSVDYENHKVRLSDGKISPTKPNCDSWTNQATAYANGECGMAFVTQPADTVVADCSNIPQTKDQKVKVYREVTSTRIGLSVTPNPPDMVLNKSKTYAVKEIKVYDENLSRIKSYEVPVASGDVAQFIIVDPQDFFDVRDYVPGGRYDANYRRYDGDGNPLTYDTCPILGLPNGYSGICDPKGEAGCNLPIYGVGAEKTITLEGDIEKTFNHYSIKWSGYVKSWKWLTVDEYKTNTNGRAGQNGGNLYAVDENDLNNNLVLMTVRANEYCDRRERYSGQINPTQAPDLPCVQYWQYQNINPDDPNDWSFVNLFMPEFDGSFETQYGYSYLNLFPVLINEEGREVPYMKDIYGLYSQYGEDDLSVVQCNPAVDECKGSSNFVEASGLANRPVNFFDKNTRVDVIRYDEFSNSGSIDTAETRFALDRRASEKGVYKESDELMKSNTGGLSIGQYIKDGDDSSGLHLKLQPGRALAMRLMPSESSKRNSDYDEQGNLVRASTRCVIAQNKSDNPDSSNYFIPTNSEEEIEAFANAKDNNIEIRPCQGSFMTFDQAPAPKPAANPNGTQTWFGETSCEQLTAKPACNQTKFISAERFCILEDGKMGDCEECMAAADPDAGIDFTLASVAPMGNAQLLSVPGDEMSGSRCYFSAACFAQNGAGCPSAETSGGHVFCLSEDTKIKMADGTEKEIAKIKAGEFVSAFNSKDSKKTELIKSKVVATVLTKKQKYMTLTTYDRVSGKETSVRITPLHKVVLSSGRGVEVQDLEAGVPILNSAGKIVMVKSIKDAGDEIDVYNLILEDHADGYIAGDLRVLSYPLMDGIKAAQASSQEKP